MITFRESNETQHLCIRHWKFCPPHRMHSPGEEVAVTSLEVGESRYRCCFLVLQQVTLPLYLRYDDITVMLKQRPVQQDLMCDTWRVMRWPNSAPLEALLVRLLPCNESSVHVSLLSIIIFQPNLYPHSYVCPILAWICKFRHSINQAFAFTAINEVIYISSWWNCCHSWLHSVPRYVTASMLSLHSVPRYVTASTLSLLQVPPPEK